MYIYKYIIYTCIYIYIYIYKSWRNGRLMGCLWDSTNQLMGYNGDNKGSQGYIYIYIMIFYGLILQSIMIPLQRIGRDVLSIHRIWEEYGRICFTFADHLHSFPDYSNMNVSISPSMPKRTGSGKSCSVRPQDFGRCERNDTSSCTHCTLWVELWLVGVCNSFLWILLGHDSATFFCVAYWNHNSSSTFSLWDSTSGASMTGMMPKQNWCLHFPCTHNSAAKDFCYRTSPSDLVFQWSMKFLGGNPVISYRVSQWAGLFQALFWPYITQLLYLGTPNHIHIRFSLQD